MGFAFFLSSCSGANSQIPPAASALTVVSSGATPGTVLTLAGSGRAASVNGKGRHASFDAPTGITLNPATGLLYVLEPPTPSIRTLTPSGVAKTLTRNLHKPTALTFNTLDGKLYVGSADSQRIERVSVSANITPFLTLPSSQTPPPNVLGQMAAGSDGMLDVTESRSGTLYQISPQKHITRNAVGPGVLAVSAGPDGVYLVNQMAGDLVRFVNDSQTVVAKSSLLHYATAMTYDPDDRAFYLVDPTHNRVLICAKGRVRILAGNGKAGEVDGPFPNSEFDEPSGIVYDHATRSVYVTDTAGNTVRALRGLP